jgi:hypothetical protein
VFLALVALCLGGLAPGKFELFDYNPVANAKAVVVSGKARFSVLTDRLIRIEWSEKVTGFIPLFATADCTSRSFPRCHLVFHLQFWTTWIGSV